MDPLWIGAASALAGIVVGALLEWWRELVAYRRSLRTRWDQHLLAGLAEYLATADRALRALLRWQEAKHEQGDNVGDIKKEALSAFEALHERSQIITLLTGNRFNPVRVAARQMRESLLPLRDAVEDNQQLPETKVRYWESEHRNARSRLVLAAQKRLGIPIDET